MSMVVYKLTPDAPELFGSEVAHDLGAFKAGCDVILAKRWSDELADVADKVYTRDLFRGTRGEAVWAGRAPSSKECRGEARLYRLTPIQPRLFQRRLHKTILMKFNTYSRRRTLTQGYYVLSKFRGLSGGVLKIFFWNLKRNRLANLIQLALQQNDVDVAAFAEVNQADFQRLIELLDGQYRPVEAIDDSAKTKLLVKSSICSQHASTVINNLTCTLMLDGVPVNASIVHLPDKRNDPHGDRRERILRRLVIELNTTKTTCPGSFNMLLGDFNCNPFDPEMVKLDSLNSTFFKEVAKRLKVRDSYGSSYPVMYNPALEFLSESNSNQGSYYWGSGDCTYYWHSLDQIVVDWQLADCIIDCRYLRQIGDTKLISNSQPCSRFSDHLPLLVTMEMGNCHDR